MIDLYCGCGRTLNDYRERVSGFCLECLQFRSDAPAAVQVEPEEGEESDVDPVTQRLMDDALKTHGHASCPRCGHRGRFIRMALVCPTHGAFGGT